MTRAASTAAGLLLALGCLVELPLVLAVGVLVLCLGTGPSATLLRRTPHVTVSQAVFLGVCGDVALLLLGVQVLLSLELWRPSTLVLAYAAAVVVSPWLLHARATHAGRRA